MRKFRSLFMMLLTLASMSVLTSCGDEEEVNPKATITFDPSADNVSLASGSPIQFKVLVTSTDKLKEFKMTKTAAGFNDDTTVTNFPAAGYEFNVNDVVTPGIAVGSTITYTFTATTNKNEVTTRTYTVTVLSDMATYTAKILGNQNATVGSFFSSVDGAVLNSNDAKNNSAKVDLVFYYSVGGTAATDLATLASPMNANAQAVYGASTTANIPSWATKNDTKFKKIAAPFGASVYDAITSGSQIQDGYDSAAAGAESNSAKQLAVGDAIGFKTAAGKYGVAKVTALTTPTTANGNRSEVTLAIKVQR
jgi:hypothetical protein